MQLGHHLTMVISSSDKNLTKNVVKENGELSFPIYQGVQFSRNLRIKLKSEQRLIYCNFFEPIGHMMFYYNFRTADHKAFKEA